MRTTVLCATLLATAVLAVVPAAAHADDLGRAMSNMGKAMKALSKDTADLTSNDAALADVSALEKASLIAKDLTPPMVDKMTGDDKTKALADYRKLMGTLIKAEVDLEGAIIDKNADDVKKDIGAIIDLMKQGHGEFRPKDNN